MKILHVVTLVAPDNPFGGPVRVALNHARALRDGGHEVQVIAGARDYFGHLPSVFDGEPVRLFRTRALSRQLGFSGMLAPSMIRWLLRNVRSFDVVHIHLARDLVTLPVAALCVTANRPYIVQAHGMIDGSTKRLARLLDVLITRRVLRKATALLFLTSTERDGLTALVPGLKNLAPISNGVPLPSPPRVREARASSKVEVLFLARLHPRKRPLLFAQAAQEIARSHPGVAFRLVGPDEGEAADLQRILAAEPDLDISWEGPLEPESTSDRLAQADVYVLPSVNEPFPMSVLEAMSIGLPVIVTDSCGLAPAITQNAAGIVASETLQSLTDAITELLDDPAKRIGMGKRAAELVQQQFTDTEVAKHLELIYEDAVSSVRAGNAE